MRQVSRVAALNFANGVYFVGEVVLAAKVDHTSTISLRDSLSIVSLCST